MQHLTFFQTKSLKSGMYFVPIAYLFQLAPFQVVSSPMGLVATILGLPIVLTHKVVLTSVKFLLAVLLFGLCIWNIL